MVRIAITQIINQQHDSMVGTTISKQPWDENSRQKHSAEGVKVPKLEENRRGILAFPLACKDGLDGDGTAMNVM